MTPALQAYAQRVWNAGALLLCPPLDGISMVPGRARVVLHREGQFQAELIMFAPGAVVPAHRHPHVDSIDTVVSGAVDLVTGSGQRVWPAKPRASGVSRWFGRFLPIAATEAHGGSVGPEGACIVSFQQWHHGTPGHIVEDWHLAGKADHGAA